MKYKQGKIFKKTNLEITEFKKVDYKLSDNNYYCFVKKQRDQGYRHVIITSNIMIKILNEYFLKRKFTISYIEFMIDDENYKASVGKIIENLNEDRGYFNCLINELTFLIEETIDIKKIGLKTRENGHSISIFIQVNGIFGINENSYNEEAKYFFDLIKGV